MTTPTAAVTIDAASAGDQGPKPSHPGRRGRPPKPGRVRVNALVPAPLVALLADDAKANGIAKSDRLAEILAAWYSR
jgi:hypothetical protein